MSFVYFTWFGEATPLAAAFWFEGFVFVADLLLVALMINRSLDMFRSVLGTWLPFLLIFMATLLTGALIKGTAGVERRREVVGTSLLGAHMVDGPARTGGSTGNSP